MEKVLLCTDLDRTILPNGAQPESPEAREVLARVAARPEVTLVYVSGRHKELIREAIREYEIPQPAFAIGDVGTTIYEVRNGEWTYWQSWEEEIGRDWAGKSRDEVVELLKDLRTLALQEPGQQNLHKVSYYAPEAPDVEQLLLAVRRRLEPQGVRASLIWSVDEAKGVGLLDVLPRSASKLHAIRFLMERQRFAESSTVFAGDSGNDLQVLTSGLQAVLVRNASEDVVRTALEQVHARGLADRLYLAQGGFLAMNGNYAAGVLEGLAHFLPVTKDWMSGR